MQFSTRSSRRQTFELPKDEGLAEWAGKIRAMQRQVDADEEEEQRRLEEEIAASRLARQRRSRGVGYSSGTTNNLNLLGNSDFTVGKEGEASSPSTDDPNPQGEKQKRQDDALRKLTSTSASPSFLSKSQSRSRSPVAPAMQARSPSLPTEKKMPEAVSLAAFIGGRATGPRLNKHAPQQDGHDPMQFEQRTHVTAPHPVFGRGGIALPGIVAKGRVSTQGTVNPPDTTERSSWSPVNHPSEKGKDRTPGTPPSTRQYADTVQQPPVAPHVTGRRERSISIPNGLSPTRSPPRSWSSPQAEALRRPVSQSSLPVGHSASPERPRTPEIRSKTPEARYKTSETLSKMPEAHSKITQLHHTPVHSTESPSPPTVSPLFTPRSPSSPTSPQSRKSPVAAHSLARPIRPDPRLSPQAPQIPPSQNPSPAFLRPPPQKDPTPSLSRLKGRGFVQNMVKVSSQLENLSAESAGSSPFRETTSSTSTRKPSVLDRWPAASKNMNSVSPPVTPKASSSPNVRVGSTPQTPSSPIPPRVTNYVDSNEILKSASYQSIPQRNAIVTPQSTRRKSLTATMPPEGSPGLGSSSTLISYIKPSKTGENPFVLPTLVPSLDTDELGVRTIAGGAMRDKSVLKAAAVVSELPAPSGKPLSHPTKDRARKPRKARDAPNSSDKIDSVSGSIAHDARSSSLELPAKSVESQPILPVEIPQTNLNHGHTGTLEEPAHQVPSPPPPSPPSSLPTHSVDVQAKTGRVTDRWVDKAIIGTKDGSASNIPTQEPNLMRPKSDDNAMVGRRALPGLASAGKHPTESNGLVARKPLADLPISTPDPTGQDEVNPKSESNGLAACTAPLHAPGPTPTQEISTSMPDKLISAPVPDPTAPVGPSAAAIPIPRKEDPPLVITARQTRTPGAGSRATAMDLAQALNNQHPPSSPGWKEHRVEPSSDYETLNMDTSKSEDVVMKPPVASRRSTVSPATQAEKRKSNYEKYSAIMLPPLKEEATPVASPAGSLSRSTGPPLLQNQCHEEPVAGELDKRLETAVQPSPVVSPILSKEHADVVYFNHTNNTLPEVDIGALAESKVITHTTDTDTMTVSVDVMVITGSTATALTRDVNIFYDSEVLAIIHRSKSKSSGLVSTAVFGWWGKRRQAGDREVRKLQDLAKRYRTTLETVRQYSEPPKFVHLLGGQLAIRQGTRTHWSSDNTAMHLVRSLNGVIYIDERDLNVKNLCSGFSYCISILQTIYVWYGRGSMLQERQAALAYGRGLADNEASVIELTESESDDDEMFWMILGDNEYAKADYWQWRRTADEVDPRIWRVEPKNNKAPILSVSSFSSETTLRRSVYIVDCIWEFFVLVGRDARGKRQNIQLAISVATKLSTHVATSRPYPPTVHVLVLPSQLPLDLQLNFRDLDEVQFNNDDVPEHMNILSSNDAFEHLQRNSWGKDALKDHTMLPLGLDSSDL